MSPPLSRWRLIVAGLIGACLGGAQAAALPDLEGRCETSPNCSSDANTTITIDFRRHVHLKSNIRPVIAIPAHSLGVGNFLAPSTPEARCGSHIYTTDYIRRTLDSVTALGAQNATAGDSEFPRPFVDQPELSSFPLLRNGDIFDGGEFVPCGVRAPDSLLTRSATVQSAPGPDRIAVRLVGKRRYRILTLAEQPATSGRVLRDYQSCEDLLAESPDD
ncbi:CSEP0407 putative effector protein [Blumeria hordei DH14]|uniref:CSEP0407 putative effector protein n=1 Tax=Blumeria graminis f. sp. hordei (strain DH14) TaxID=546991 RepID=N1JDB7_BLUG1|nr:CSEP0407 putative effector protein [Blumeria hordei DH14]